MLAKRRPPGSNDREQLKDAFRDALRLHKVSQPTDFCGKVYKLLEQYAFGPAPTNKEFVACLSGESVSWVKWRNDDFIFRGPEGDAQHFSRLFEARRMLSWVSFPIITQENLTILLDMAGGEGTRVVELGCGVGVLGRRLADRGVRLVSQVDTCNWLTHEPFYFLAEQAGREVGDSADWVREYPDAFDTALLSWPYMDEQAVNVWRALPSGKRLIVIGESWGGCTANDAFFEETETCLVQDSWHTFMRWQTVRDHAQLYVKP